MSEDWSKPELVRSLQRIEEGQAALNKKLDDLPEKYVTKGEHVAVVARLDSEIATLKAGRPQWTAVAAIVVSVFTALLALVPLITK